MLALGIVLNVIGLGFFCCVLFTLAVYALPFFVGMTAGLYAHGAAAGAFEAIVLGLLASAFTLVIGQTIFSLVRTPILRIAVALMFAVPAALAGYYATFGLAGLTMTSDPWRQVFAVIGAVVIGVTAWARLAASPPEGSRGHGGPALSYVRRRLDLTRRTLRTNRRPRIACGSGARRAPADRVAMAGRSLLPVSLTAMLTGDHRQDDFNTRMCVVS